MSEQAPWYHAQADEVALFEAAYAARMPVMLVGPTGCGKTRFVEHMAWRIARERGRPPLEPSLITIACHDDLGAADLVGRHLLEDGHTVWADGPLTRAARSGAICYLDEVVEARRDTIVVIHALTDHRRLLPIERTGELLPAHPDFLLVVSYNPGYQSVLKDMKPSTRQRFMTLAFDYPAPEHEALIIAHESGVDEALARALARLAASARRLEQGPEQPPVSTRLLVHAAQLMVRGIDARRACEAALVRTVGDDEAMRQALRDLVETCLP
ncbi:MAG: CbbQ/NirQ/NorQ/GpvN family protein [Burkholderiaceae bacterium]